MQGVMAIMKNLSLTNVRFSRRWLGMPLIFLLGLVVTMGCATVVNAAEAWYGDLTGSTRSRLCSGASTSSMEWKAPNRGTVSLQHEMEANGRKERQAAGDRPGSSRRSFRSEPAGGLLSIDGGQFRQWVGYVADTPPNLLQRSASGVYLRWNLGPHDANGILLGITDASSARPAGAGGTRYADHYGRSDTAADGGAARNVWAKSDDLNFSDGGHSAHVLAMKSINAVIA